MNGNTASPFLAHLQSLLASTSTASQNGLPPPNGDAGSHARRNSYDQELSDALDNLESSLDRHEPTTTTSSLLTDTSVIDRYLRDHKLGLSARKASSDAKNDSLQWLKRILPDTELYDRTITLIASEEAKSDEVLSTELLDLLGFDAFDAIPEIVAKRKVIQAEAAVSTSAATNGHTSHAPSRDTSAFNTPDVSDSEAARSRGLANGLGGKRAKQSRLGKANGKARMTIEELEQMHLQKLEEAANRPLVNPNNRHVADAQAVYPHVYINEATRSMPTISGKLMLPLGSTKVEHEGYEETTIPAPTKLPTKALSRLLPVKDLPILAQRSFSYSTLNRLQSIVYHTAFETSENMLVCAPTGAGKTDVAVLSVLRALSMYADIRLSDSKMRNTDFKIVYVAPMKALASEIVVKMTKRFSWCGLAVRELTGDMQMTRKEIAETQMIVTTPEKWDVVTRKSTGEGELSALLKLLIVDEVHLLAEDRGAVLESIIARTLRQVESSQSLIRIVGLSATLPNYVDVAEFLRVNPNVGLFFFDSAFRPVPLEQHFVGANGKPGSQQSKDNIDKATFDKTLQLVKDGHQVLIFVHARKDTVKTALMLKERAMEADEMAYFNIDDKVNGDRFTREVQMSRNRELKELVKLGIGIHHAGMLRSDRNLSEKLFESNVTNILVCTATLAWGVNLPAYAVIIKGTQLYDSGKGQFIDLGILDVLQMFGRAGRPQYETQGVAYIITGSDKADHYITAVNQQIPIESTFVNGLADALNAEIALGTVASIDEAVRWLGYTFLHVRMRKNPMVYGMSATDLLNDPALGTRRRDLVLAAVRLLSNNGMVIYDQHTDKLESVSLGKIASKYYIRSASIEIFNATLRPNMTEADLLTVLSKSTEFNQIAVRESESEELKNLVENVIPCQVAGAADTNTGKTNVLLQAFICRAQLVDFALISDMAYVAQNAARIARALLDIAVFRKSSQNFASLLALAKAIDKRLWPWSNPFEQLGLHADIIYNMNERMPDATIEDIAASTPSDLGSRLHLNERFGSMLRNAAHNLPRLSARSSAKPLTCDLLRIDVILHRDFTWNVKLHGQRQSFYVWLSDDSDLDMLVHHQVEFREDVHQSTHAFTVPFTKDLRRVVLHASSQEWFSSDLHETINLSHVQLPSQPPAFRHMPSGALSQATSAQSTLLQYGMRSIIPSVLETQIMHTILHSEANAFIATSNSQARNHLLALAVLKYARAHVARRVVVAVPHLAAARYYREALRHLCRDPKIDITIIHTDQQRRRTYAAGQIAVVTPVGLKWLSLQIRLLDTASGGCVLLPTELQDMQADYELGLSHFMAISPQQLRIIGFSSSLYDSRSFASWFSAKSPHVYSYGPTVSDPLLSSQFIEIDVPHSPAFYKATIKPAFDLMRSHVGSSICYVSHRGQCYSVLSDFVIRSAANDDRFTSASEETLSIYAERLLDSRLAEPLLRGLSVLHDRMDPSDRTIVEHLYNARVIRALILPHEMCWNATVAASLVITLGTKHSVSRGANSTRQVESYPLANYLRMRSTANGENIDEPARFVTMTQPQDSKILSKYLTSGPPCESDLFDSDNMLNEMLALMHAGKVTSREQCFYLLSSTFAAHRLQANPGYYMSTAKAISQALDEIVGRLLQQAVRNCLVTTAPAAVGDTLQITAFGKRIIRSGHVSQSLMQKLFSLKDDDLSVDMSDYKIGDLAQHQLLAFVRQLAKSTQRRIGVIEGQEASMDIKRALMIPFLLRKIPKDAALQNAQAELAVHVLIKLHKTDAKGE